MARAEVRVDVTRDTLNIDVDITDDTQTAQVLLALVMETVDWAFVKIKNEQSSNI